MLGVLAARAWWPARAVRRGAVASPTQQPLPAPSGPLLLHSHRCDWYLLAWPVILSCSSTKMHSSLIISSSCVALPAATVQGASAAVGGAWWVGRAAPRRRRRRRRTERAGCISVLQKVLQLHSWLDAGQAAAGECRRQRSPSHVDSRCRCCWGCRAPAGGCWAAPRCGSVMVAATESRCTPPVARPCCSGSSWSSRPVSAGRPHHQARIDARRAAVGR